MSGGPTKKTFASFVAPETLLDIVRNTAPFLFDREVIETTWTYGGPTRRFSIADIPYWQIVRNSDHVVSTPKPTDEQWVDYFRLCVAAHFATVATFVPSDVDTKIRNHLWFDRKLSADALTAMKDIALATVAWDIRPVSQRWLPDERGNVFTGHDGERLSIITAGMLALSKSGDEQGAQELENAAIGIIERESTFFLELLDTKGRERDLLMLAAVITHDAGDIDQGLSVPFERPGIKQRIGRLAHEGFDRFGGAYARAAKVYKVLLAAEGHRNYPLRALRELRFDPDLLFPSSPFLDAWGERLATRRGWSSRDKALVLEGLMNACVRVRNQVGYYRAIAGMNAAYSGGIEALARELSVNVRKALKEPHYQKHLQVSRAAFEHDMATRARKILASST